MLCLKHLALGTIVVSLAATTAHAEVGRVCDVSFQQPDGSWSTPQRREVTFYTGREMNRRAPTGLSYEGQDEYAVITWNASDVTIIELDAAFNPGSDVFTGDDFKRFFDVRRQIDAHEVNDARRRRWRIVAKESGPPARFIDPRAQQ